MAIDSSTPQPILIAYDGSPGASAAIEEAGRLFASRRAITLAVWQSVESVAPAAAAGMPADVVGRAARELDATTAAAADELAGEAAELARAGGLEAEPRAVRMEDNVWVTLCHAASELDAAVVVVGSRGRSAVKSLLLGSVSSGVVHHSERPTLVVPVPGDAGTPGPQ